VNYLLNLYQPYFVQARVPGAWFGIALAMASLMGVATSRYAYLAENFLGVRKGILIATLLPGVFYICMAAISYSWISFLLFIFAYGSMNIQRPMFLDYINRHVESENRATVMSLINMISGIYIAVFGLIIGGIADISLSYAFIFMGAVILIGAVSIRIESIHVDKAPVKHA
jgi:hypothetical protein